MVLCGPDCSTPTPPSRPGLSPSPPGPSWGHCLGKPFDSALGEMDGTWQHTSNSRRGLRGSNPESPGEPAPRTRTKTIKTRRTDTHSSPGLHQTSTQNSVCAHGPRCPVTMGSTQGSRFTMGLSHHSQGSPSRSPRHTGTGQPREAGGRGSVDTFHL